MKVYQRFEDGVLVEHLINGVPQPVEAKPTEWPLVLKPLKLLAKSTRFGGMKRASPEFSVVP